MKIYRLAGYKIVYHVTDKDFSEIGGNSGLGIHVAKDKSSALKFASEWYSKSPFYVMQFAMNMTNPLKTPDLGMFNSPSRFLSYLWDEQIITDEEYLELARKFGASDQSIPTDYDDYDQMGQRDDYSLSGGKAPIEFNAEDTVFLQKEGLPYEDWETVRQLLKKKGYDGLEYENRVDANGTCYVVFYPSQLVLMGKKSYQSAIELELELH